MAYSIVEGIANNQGIDYCPFCMSDNLDTYGNGAVKCCYCDRKFYVMETDID